MRIRLGQVALECHGVAGEEPINGGDVAFEERREVEFGRGDVDPWQQGAVEDNLETVFAHASTSLSRLIGVCALPGPAVPG
ncbi:hypothetical protein D3C81_1944340 [compost metagenome]